MTEHNTSDRGSVREQDRVHQIETRRHLSDISPSEALSIQSITGAGRLRTAGNGDVHGAWAAFDPQKLIQLLEEYHEDDLVSIALTWKEMQAGVEAPVLFIGDVTSENTDFSVLSGVVGGDDADELADWRDSRGDDDAE